ncbi:MAG TPA: DUF4148 domain-containing protein [Caballeronia sp.]|nr:DUF4148 domain-containing protein [Caballeronia sp.]
MMTNPKRTLLAGLLLGAVVIGASVMRSGEETLPGAQSGPERDGASISGELNNGPAETRRSNPASTSNHSDDISHILQAIRDSLKRNDLASAKVLLGAVQTLHKDDSRALTLQKELQAREEKADAVPPVAAPENPPSTAKSTRSISRLPARAERSRESASTLREHTFSTSRHSRIMDAPKIKARSNSDVSGADAEATSPALGAGQKDPGSPEVAPTVTPAIASTPARPALVRPTPPVEEALPPARPVAPQPLPVQASQAPKTRAQVRAELDRARADGSLPRFGNPDPAGPGGVPSSTKRGFGSE